MERWAIRNPVYKFFYVYLGAAGLAIKLIRKHGFDKDKIFKEINDLGREAASERAALQIKNAAMDKALKEMEHGQSGSAETGERRDFNC